MDNFYVDPKDVCDQTVVIRGEEYRHLARVLRKKAGDHILVTDGCDNSYEVVIRLIDRVHAECSIIETKHRLNETKLDIALAVSLLRNPARFDFLVEKATELGVRTFIPTICERTVPKREKHARLEKVAISAMKQCGRSYLPRIVELTAFAGLVGHARSYSLRLIPHETTEHSQFIGSVLKHHTQASSVLLAIGPEGGFTEGELAAAIHHGFIPISLGPRRLRSETAALSALSWVVGGW
ncbi:MAG: 16S rRNA (uracil(1498)-N(3))-methyltransferase [Ignavibacteria bacterium]|nr:16S rRNA (uracil(1498)-N(3))-methyltransferase [Ignavibacteria bacterium]